MGSNKISRKSLKEPDEFITFSTKLIQKIVAYKAKIAMVFGALAAVVLLVSGMSYLSEKAEDRGSLALTRVMDRYDTTASEKGAEQAYETVQADFEKLLVDYSGKNCGKFARLVFANICYRAGDYDKAIELFQRAAADFKSESMMKNIAVCGLGYALEEKKEYEKAAGLFEELATDPDAIMADEALFALGRMYGLMEKPDKRTEVLGQLIEQYPDSMYKALVTGASAG